MSLVSTPRTWVVGETVTAANMNAEIRDAITGIEAAWDAWTPALTAATTNPTLGTGSSVTGTSLQIGKKVDATAEIVFGSSGVVAGSGLYSISLPVAQVAAAGVGGRVIGSGVYFDSSAAAAAQWYHLDLIASTTTTTRAVAHQFGILSALTPVTPAASDQIRVEFHYQAG